VTEELFTYSLLRDTCYNTTCFAPHSLKTFSLSLRVLVYAYSAFGALTIMRYKPTSQLKSGLFKNCSRKAKSDTMKCMDFKIQ